MTDVTPEQLALARRIAAEVQPAYGSAVAEKAALRAIIETTELAAKLADSHATYGNRVPERVAGYLRCFDHLKGQS